MYGSRIWRKEAFSFGGCLGKSAVDSPSFQPRESAASKGRASLGDRKLILDDGNHYAL